MKRFLMVGVVALVGCGGDASPQDKCEDIGDSFCDRAVECIAGAQGMHEECFSAYKAQGTCARAKDIGPSYDSCMDQIQGASCATLFPTSNGEVSVALPNACRGVVQTGEGPPDLARAANAGLARFPR